MHKPFQLIRNTERLVMGAQTAFFPNTLHGPKQYWPFAVHTQAFSSGNRAWSG
jgi:hypothetical protein